MALSSNCNGLKGVLMLKFQCVGTALFCSVAMGALTPAIAQEAAPAAVGEVIVTAQKRSERLNDVPVPVAVLSGPQLVETNQLRFQDFFSRVPGLSFSPTSQGVQNLAIRGITAGVANPTVAVTVNDVPVGASTSQGGGNRLPDIDPGELAQVEVLRGPQGTLYGASSIGGLMKLVTVDPKTDAFSGSIQAGLSTVKNGDQAGFNVRGSVNVPIAENLAVRANLFSRRDPGYVDNIATGQKGVNTVDTTGGRLAALWSPSDKLTVKLDALLQHTKGDGPSDVYPALGGLKTTALVGTGRFDRKSQIYTATITTKVGGMDLTSTTGYGVNRYKDSADGPTLGGLIFPLFATRSVAITADIESRKFSQEVRLASPADQRVSWIVGAFYTNEDSSFVQEVLGANPTTGASVGTGVSINIPTTYRDYAAFGDVTFHATDRFEIQVGGRASKIKQTFRDSYVGPLTSIFVRGATSPLVRPEIKVDDSPMTFLVTPKFKLTPDVMIYARAASGYRPGGINVGIGVPPGYAADTTLNYDLGLKGNFLDGALSIDASAYYIDWKDIQLTLLSASGLTYRDNIGRATSKGLEVTATVRPTRSLSITAWSAWGDAKLSEDFPVTSTIRGRSGDRLPFSSKYTGSVAVDQEFGLWGNVRGYANVNVQYVGSRLDNFTSTGTRVRLGRYAKTDLSVGLRDGGWNASLFVNNLTDKQGVIGSGTPAGVGFLYIQPRTVGLNVGRKF